MLLIIYEYEGHKEFCEFETREELEEFLIHALEDPGFDLQSLRIFREIDFLVRKQTSYEFMFEGGL